MREILFRGKKSKDGQWAKGLLVKDVKGHMRIQFNPTAFSVVVIPETVGQFTGLTDKSGVNIFEGDICRDSEGKYMVVSWSKKFASWVLNRKGWAFSHWFGESCNPEDVEVVGNIYDNPELLNP